MTSTNVAAIKKSICDSIRCTDDAELGMVHIGLPFDIGGGDLIELAAKPAEDGSFIITDCGSTLDRVFNTSDALDSSSFKSRLDALMDFYRIEKVDDELTCKVSSIDELGETVFELCQVLAAIGNVVPRIEKRSPLTREKGHVRQLAKSRLMDAGIMSRPDFHHGNVIKGRIGEARIPVRLDYSVGHPKFPDTGFICSVLRDSQSVLLADAKFSRTKSRKTFKKVSLVAMNSSEIPTKPTPDWSVSDALAILSQHGPVIDLDSPEAVEMLQGTVPKLR